MKEVIAFATLFLGLASGPQEVEVLVGREVAWVELSVDGKPSCRIDGELWKATCNLGRQLEPRELEAIAYSESGDELGRTSQWINTARPPAQTEILLDMDPDTEIVTARLRGTSITSEHPESISVQFDGQSLPADDPAAIELPPHDPEQLHYLRIDVQFADGLSSTIERTFGGSFVDEIDTELTAVPLELPTKRDELPSGAGLLQAHGEQLPLVDVVKGPAEIILVRDRSAQRDLDHMATSRNLPNYRAVASLKRGYSLRLLRPVAELSPREGLDMRLFGSSPTLTATDGGLLWILTSFRPPMTSPESQKLSDAVAVAGMTVASSGHRRAVVLLLGPDAADHSQHGAAEVRRYLAQMRVPLVVWSTAGAGDTPWGPAADTSSWNRMERQTRMLTKSLERQRIAWVRGVYLPDEVTLSATDSGIRLAGS